MSASKKLGADDAQKLVGETNTLVVAKAKKVTLFEGKIPRGLAGKDDLEKYDVQSESFDDETSIPMMLGATGNLRAPTIRVGKNLIVGFNEAVYEHLLT